MPRNIEIKAKVSSLDEVKAKAAQLSKDTEGVLIKQNDTFFKVGEGRLKLRFLTEKPSELIFYKREDKEGPKMSDYKTFKILGDNPKDLEDTLGEALGVLGKVKKDRVLFMVGQTRVHCDRVDGLGDFMELEVELREDQTEAEGVAIAEDLMAKLGVEKENLISAAYMDLLLQKSENAPKN